MSSVEIIDLGTMPYGECWELQQQLFNELQQQKRGAKAAPQTEKEGAKVGYILAVDHPAVYTLGKSGKSSNILFTEEQLTEIGADFYHIDRGGDVTFHGPGQIVLYPIIDLEALHIGLKEYIGALEQAAIDTAAHWGVTSQRIDGAAGVWVAKDNMCRKICAIGVKSSRYVTMHGLAFNVETDLKYFNFINPCGFTDRGVTSLEVECGERVSFERAKELLLNNLIKILNVKIYKK